MTYWRLHYHLIWGTHDREPSLTPEREKMLYGVLYDKGKELGLKIHAAGNTEEHVHVVVSIPPKLAVADCVRHLKGASAYAINHMRGSDDKFKWQEGYGALTISEGSLRSNSIIKPGKTYDDTYLPAKPLGSSADKIQS